MQISIPTNQIKAFCKRYRIKRLALFGSVLHDGFRPDSDVDVLVEFDVDSQTTFLDMVEIQDTLSHMLGRRVDLLTPNALSTYFRDDVLETAQVIYE